MSIDTETDVERRLRAALTARAELVRHEDVAGPTPIVRIRPRGRSAWAVVAAAAVVLLVLGALLQPWDRRQSEDDVAPRPDGSRVVLPPDVGRDWQADDLSTPARLDLDGDGRREKVDFLAEPTKELDGRVRMQTTLSVTGEEAYGIAELGSTIGTTALDPIDADSDGDQELVLYVEDLEAVGGGGHPLVFDLVDGLLVEAVVQKPELLLRGTVPEPDMATEHYDLVRLHDYWTQDGQLFSSRSLEAYARGNMTLLSPRVAVVDSWEWVLGDDGVLRPEDAGCLLQEVDRRRPCGDDPVDSPPSIPAAPAAYVGAGESVDLALSYPFSARIEAGDPAVLVVESGGRTLRRPLDVRDPRLATAQPLSIFYDGASVVVTSSTDPFVLQVLVERDGRLVALEPTGEIPLRNDGTTRTWLTESGSLLSAVAQEDGSWILWTWLMVSGSEMAALPWGPVCFDDDDLRTMRGC